MARHVITVNQIGYIRDIIMCLCINHKICVWFQQITCHTGNSIIAALIFCRVISYFNGQNSAWSDHAI